MFWTTFFCSYIFVTMHFLERFLQNCKVAFGHWEHQWVNPSVAGGYFCQYKMMQKCRKMTEILAIGYSSESTQRELSNKYQHDRVEIVIENL